MSSIKLIAGLGNPGVRYEKTRHNIGFQVLDLFAKSHSDNVLWRDKFQSQIFEVTCNGQKIILAKPQTFMNRSGDAIGEILKFYQWQVSQLVVVHDELDLDVGTIRLKSGGGDGGHNGLRSTTEALSSPDYIRVRVGIGHPRRLKSEADQIEPIIFDGEVHDWVLSRFFPKEIPIIGEAIKNASKSLEELIKGGLKQAQARFNAKN